MLLLFPVEPLSAEGVRSLTARYGDGAGYDAWLLAQQDPDYAWDEQVAVGLWRRLDEPCDDAEVVALMTGAEVRRGPAPFDRDESGRCRCGCMDLTRVEAVGVVA